MQEAEPRPSWHLDFHDSSRPFAEVPGLPAHLDLNALSCRNGVTNGTPIFVGPDDRPDRDVNCFWRDRSVRRLAETTRSRYAYSLRSWLNFTSDRGTNWRCVSPDDVEDYKLWRLSADDAPVHVQVTTWAADLAALRRFYDWAARQVPGVDNPILRRAGRAAADPDSEELELSPSSRRRDVKWLTPDAYRLWRDVGLAGYTMDGLQAETWVGVNEDRDVAYADTLFGTGLRRAELASLLTLEVLDVPRRGLRRAWLSAACAKRRRGRAYWLPGTAAARLNFYLREGSRGAAVARAQAAGRYDNVPERWVLGDVHASGALTVTTPDGRTQRATLDGLDPRVRRSLYREGDSGWEPLWLWLNQDGTPRSAKNWNKVFSAANQRVAKAMDGQSPLFARPHMLRHSFALRWYTVATFAAWQRSAGLSQADQRDLRQQLGDVWFLLATLLGHRTPETTRDYYLEPFQTLQIEQLLAMMDADDRTALERMVEAAVAEEPRVLKVAHS